MRIILCFIVAVGTYISNAQIVESEQEIGIGDSLFFVNCSGDHFEYMDLYTKTRFEKDSLVFDSTNGVGFYQSFFSTGDFDVSRLPCEYDNTYGLVVSIIQLQDDKGNVQNVTFVVLEKWKTVVWVTEKAYEAEVILSPVIK